MVKGGWMSFKNEEAADRIKVKWEGAERFSDTCVNCTHTRADHLPIGVMRPVSGGECRVPLLLADYVGKDEPRPAKKEGRVYCDCRWKPEAT